MWFPPLLFTWRHFLDVISCSRHLGRYHAGFWAIHAYFEGLGHLRVSVSGPESKQSWIRKSSSFHQRRTHFLSEFWWVVRRMAQCGGSSAQKQTSLTVLNHVRSKDEMLDIQCSSRSGSPDAPKCFWGRWTEANEGNKVWSAVVIQCY